jgi:hypothetical protein
MSQTFRYKPAPLRGVTDWALDGSRLTGPKTDLDLGTVTGARFVESSVQTLRHRRLDLLHPAGTVRISANLPRSAGPDAPHRAAHRALILAVLDILPPETPVAFGETPALRGIKFAIGVLAVLMGGGIAVTAMVAGMNRNAVTEVGIGLTVLTLFGLWYAAQNAPWTAQPELTAQGASSLIQVLDGLSSKETPQTTGS